jgi:hypothetical protein
MRFEGWKNNYKHLQSKRVKGKKMKKYGVRNEWRMSKIKVQINVYEYPYASPSVKKPSK